MSIAETNTDSSGERKTSSCWDHFVCNDSASNKAKCIKCEALIAYNASKIGSTSNLWLHLLSCEPNKYFEMRGIKTESVISSPRTPSKQGVQMYKSPKIKCDDASRFEVASLAVHQKCSEFCEKFFFLTNRKSRCAGTTLFLLTRRLKKQGVHIATFKFHSKVRIRQKHAIYGSIC
jgi:hypothetical protein